MVTGLETIPSPGVPQRAVPTPAVRSTAVVRSWRSLWVALIVPAILLTLWSGVSVSGMLPPGVIPSPWAVLRAGYDFIMPTDVQPLPGVVTYRGAVLTHGAATATRVAAGYGLAVLLGVPLGILLGASRWAAALLDPLFQALRPIPSLAWLPLALAWFGLGASSTIFLVFLGAVFPILVAASDAVRRVPRAYCETALMLGAPPRTLAWRVYLPAALPGILTGLRLGVSLAWMVVMVGELTGVAHGIGAMMTAARESGRLDVVIIGMVMLGVCGALSDWALRRVSRPATRWAER
jgi:NitT/TauT family transport system permease protein